MKSAVQSNDLEGTSSSESSSTSGSEMEETSFEPQSLPGRFNPPSAPEGFEMWQHRKSRIMHLMDQGHKVTFVCGRVAGAFHTKDVTCTCSCVFYESVSFSPKYILAQEDIHLA